MSDLIFSSECDARNNLTSTLLFQSGAVAHRKDLVLKHVRGTQLDSAAMAIGKAYNSPEAADIMFRRECLAEVYVPPEETNNTSKLLNEKLSS